MFLFLFFSGTATVYEPLTLYSLKLIQQDEISVDASLDVYNKYTNYFFLCHVSVNLLYIHQHKLHLYARVCHSLTYSVKESWLCCNVD